MYLRLNVSKSSGPIPFVLFVLVGMLCLDCKEAPKKMGSEAEELPIAPEKTREPMFEDLEGRSIALADYQGNRVLLNYWATWCRPCIEEMPALVKLQKHLAEENYVFLFASDQSVKKIRDFKVTRGFDFQYIKYNGALAEQQISALPVTLIYNEVGEQVARFDGGVQWDSPEMIEQLKELR